MPSLIAIYIRTYIWGLDGVLNVIIIFFISPHDCGPYVITYIGQLHPFTVLETDFWVCAVLVFASVCSLGDSYMMSCFFMLFRLSLGWLCPWLFTWLYLITLSEIGWFCFCYCMPPWMFLPLDFLFEYWIELDYSGLLYVRFTFSMRIFCRGVPGFATDCPCGVWCRGLTTCLL